MLQWRKGQSASLKSRWRGLRNTCCRPCPQPFSLALQIPIYAANVSEDETWGIPFNATDCPTDLCYNRTTRTKW